MYDLIIRDATIVTSAGRQVADVAILDGRFAYVGPRPPRPAKRELSAIGKFLIPGVIDTGALLSPGDDPEAWAAESRAAVTGGVTTVFALPDGDRPVVDGPSARARLAVAAASSWCHFGLWGRATGDNAAALGSAATDGSIAAILTGLGSIDRPGVIPHAALDAYAGLGALLGVEVHSDDPLRLRASAEGAEGSPEALAVMRAVRDRSQAVHWMHLSTARELDLLDPVRGDLPVTAGVTPHHLFLSSEEDGEVHTLPPVRAEHDRRTLWAAVRRGRIDCLASDHRVAKEQGIPGIELMFPLMLSAVKYGRLSLEMLVALCAESPARVFGLTSKGRVAKGADADLVLFSEGEITRVTSESLQSRAGWSPWLDREAAPKPDLVLVAGETAAVRGEFVAERRTARRVDISR